MKKFLITTALVVLLSANILTPMVNAGELDEIPENTGTILEDGIENGGEGNLDKEEQNDDDTQDSSLQTQQSGVNSQNDDNDGQTPQNDNNKSSGTEWNGSEGSSGENNNTNSVDPTDTDKQSSVGGEGDDENSQGDEDVVMMPAMAPLMAPMLQSTPPATSTGDTISQPVELVSGPDFNSIIESLAGDLSNITAIAKGTESEMQAATSTGDISEARDGSIVAWYDNGTLYYYTSGNIVMNSDSSVMFKNCSNLTDISALSTWNTSNVTSLYDFFNGCSSLTDVSAVENWNVSSVSDMRSIFYGIGATTIDLSNWNTSSATQMNNMFQACSNLTDIDLSGWDTRNVTNMRYMFAQTPNLSELNLGSFNTSNVTDMVGMFFIPSGTTPSLTTIYVSDKFVINSAADTNMMFKRQKNLVGQDGYKCSTLCDEDTNNGDYAHLDNEYTLGYFTVAPDMVSVVLNYDPNTPGSLVEVKTIAKGGSISEPAISDKNGYTTLGWYDLATNQEFTSWNAINQNVTLYAKYQASVDYATFVAGSTFKSRLASLVGSVSNVKKIVRADKLNNNAATQKVSTDDSVPVRAWYENGTVYYYSEVEKIYLDSDSSNMFNGFSNLESIDMKGWDTSGVTTMLQMFSGCTKLKELDLSGWDTSGVTTMKYMFNNCTSLEKIKGIENRNVLNVGVMAQLFYGCKSLIELDLSGWDTSNVYDMYQMFRMPTDNSSALKTIYASEKFVTTNLNSGRDGQMFQRTVSLVGGDGTVWNSSYVTKTRARIDNLPGQPGYFTDRSLYAKVTFMDEGVEVLSQLAKKGTLLTMPTVQKKLNKKVTWYKNGLTETWDFDNDDVDSDVTLYAKWGCVDEAEEKNGVCVLTVAENQRKAQAQTSQDLELYFVDSTSNVDHYTIMDRNMGATSTGITSTDSYGYYYQWGNNYGFSYEDAESQNIPTTSTKVPYSIRSEGEKSNYSSDVFVTVSESDANVSWHDGEDNQLKNNDLWGDITNTLEARQGPCPDGYYVPRMQDWSSVLSSWKGAVEDESAYDQYASHLLLPLAGDVKKEEAYHQNEGIGNYWSSSLNGTRWNAYRMKVEAGDFKSDSNEKRATGHPVRCFKNVYNTPITIEANGGQKAVITIVEDEIVTLGTPKRGTDNFLGWYTTPNFLNGTNVNTGDDITGKTGLYARWEGDEEAYVITFVNEDGTELQKVEVAFGAMPSYSGTPTKASDKDYTYTFDKWEPEIVPVTGDATYTATYTATPIPTGGGGGGTKLQRDYCPDGDYSDSYYDGDCGMPENGTENCGEGESENCGEGEGQTHGSAGDEGGYTDEELSAYEWAYKYGITTIDNIQDADPDGYVIRGHMAKMVVNFMINVLGFEMPESMSEECLTLNNGRIPRESEEIRAYAMQSCALGVMGIEMKDNNFLANDIVSRAEFGTIISRILWGTTYNVKHTKQTPYYIKHLDILNKEEIMTQIDQPLTRKELRKRVWVMMKRISEKE